MKPVTSGFGFVDLIIPGLHKANGISRLLKRWKVSPQECVGIGDSGNDAEMLKLVKYSFAMGNAAESIRDVSRYSTDDNNHRRAERYSGGAGSPPPFDAFRRSRARPLTLFHPVLPVNF